MSPRDTFAKSPQLQEVAPHPLYSWPIAGRLTGAAALEGSHVIGLDHSHLARVQIDAVRSENCTVDPGKQREGSLAHGFNHALAQMQRLWFAGDYASAADAARLAASLMSPLVPTADVLRYHLFSVLVLGRLKSSNTGTAGNMHCAEIRRLASAGSTSVSATAEFAHAVNDRCAGKTLEALSRLERTHDKAARLGQHWIAAVAAEEAALAASQAWLHTAVVHYRRLALTSYKKWGADGRIDMLINEWGGVDGFLAVEPDSGSARSRAAQAVEVELSIAHEINQPLAAIALHAAAAHKWLGRAEPNVARALKSLLSISEAASQAGEIVGSVNRLVSQGENNAETVDVDQAILDVTSMLECSFRKHGIRTELKLDSRSTPVKANRVQLKQVITNLFVNAIESLSGGKRKYDGGYVMVETFTTSGEEVEIIVEDDGPGVDPVHRDIMFSRRFTTKAGNTGMGLPICLAIIRAHHGTIVFEPCDPHGARFRIRFPIHRLE
ncbi:sensor histidine kinase [Massilia sp. Root418]|uniref:sensor histidine kinase n=1 Tax=Massilia sp. Root418 TaxID=1736532 RepID=UPI0009EBF050|nr:HAMP domain-containing sensor histidine kinase [Massilia sp. Root418]